MNETKVETQAKDLIDFSWVAEQSFEEAEEDEEDDTDAQGNTNDSQHNSDDR